MRPCPICESPPEGMAVRHTPYVTVLKCGRPACGHLYAQSPSPGQGMPPMPDLNAEMAEHGEGDGRLIRRLQRDGMLFPGVRVLDIGAGTGRVSAAIRATVAGAHIQCLEPEPQARAHVAKQGFALVDSLDDVQGKVDLILLVEVIEHVDDPTSLMRSCGKLLGVRGEIFLTTPCGETSRGFHPSGGYDVPEHIHFFTEQSLRNACRAAGLWKVAFLGDFLHSHERGTNYPLFLARTAMRPIRDAITGRQRLIAYVS